MIKKKEKGMLIALLRKNMLNEIDFIQYAEILENKYNQFNEIVVTQTSFMVKNLFDKRIKHIK